MKYLLQWHKHVRAVYKRLYGMYVGLAALKFVKQRWNVHKNYNTIELLKHKVKPYV